MTSVDHICSIVHEPEHSRSYCSNTVENMLFNYLYDRRYETVLHLPAQSGSASAVAVRNARLAIDLNYHTSQTGDTYLTTLTASRTVQQMYEHCATTFHTLRDFYRYGRAKHLEKKKKIHHNNPAGRALFAQAYLQQIQNQKIAQLVPYSKGNEDLAAILYLDSLVTAVGGEEMMAVIEQEADVQHKTDGEISFPDLVADVMQPYTDDRNLPMHYRMEMEERARDEKKAKTPVKNALLSLAGKVTSSIATAPYHTAYQATKWSLTNVVPMLCGTPQKYYHSRSEVYTGMVVIPLCLAVMVGSTYSFCVTGSPIAGLFATNKQNKQQENNQHNKDRSTREHNAYTVKHGDSLSKIAQVQCRDRNAWREIQQLNNLPRKVLYPRERLKLPTRCGRR